MTDKAQPNAIQAAIARAQEAASAVASPAGGAAPGLPTAPDGAAQGAIVAGAGGAVGTYVATQAPATLDGFLDQGVNLKPDHWLQTKNTGFGIKEHAVPIEDLGPIGLALPSDMQPFFGLRVTVNGSTTYFKTVDRITCLKTGRPWAQLIAEAANHGSREYKGFDIRLTALQDVKDMKGTVVVKAGETMGYSTSITNYNDMASFALKVRQQNLFNTDLVLEVANDVRKNDKNKDGWGALVVKTFAPMTQEVIDAVAAAQSAG